ncbi:MAG TPA: HipA domain-containing protein [Candidatus Elarobacter sp.]|nr:HipA domain-containing protein [Candidatus Elarobacter sp.]
MLDGRIVGTISNLAGDSNLFAFDDDYVADANRPVLSQSFLDRNGHLMLTVPRTERQAPAFFANLLPEETNVMRALVAKQYGIADRARDFPFLDVLGEDLPGAVITTPIDVFGEAAIEAATAAGPVDQGKRPFRFSLAGAQVKLSASLIGKRLTIPVDGYGGSWIVKPATNDWPRLPENEFAVMSLAASIGLNVPDIRLEPIEDIVGFPRDLSRLRDDEPPLAYSIRRFDRGETGRTHGEDYNQIAGVMPGSKYDVVTSEWLAQVTNELCSREDVDEFVRRLIFGVLVGNGDMHAKNWSVQYPDGRNARLAPVYDFVCTRVYRDDTLALPVAERNRFAQIDREAIASFARGAELPVGETLRTAEDVVERFREAWRSLEPTLSDRKLAEAIEANLADVPLASGR